MKFEYDMPNLVSSDHLEDETQIPKDKDFLWSHRFGKFRKTALQSYSQSVIGAHPNRPQ